MTNNASVYIELSSPGAQIKAIQYYLSGDETLSIWLWKIPIGADNRNTVKMVISPVTLFGALAMP